MEKNLWLWLIIIFAIAFARLHFIARRKHFVCPHCGERFKAGWFRLLMSPHFLLYRYLRCPACGRRSAMRMADDE